jgi:hypothetical protein
MRRPWRLIAVPSTSKGPARPLPNDIFGSPVPIFRTEVRKSFKVWFPPKEDALKIEVSLLRASARRREAGATPASPRAASIAAGASAR